MKTSCLMLPASNACPNGCTILRRWQRARRSMQSRKSLLAWRYRPMAILKPEFDRIPRALVELPRWVTWAGKKVPFDPSVPNTPASVTDPDTWGTFDTARNAYDEGGRDGVGIVLNGDGLVGIDLDNCVKHGKPDPQALALLERIGSRYIEFSPSGRGLRGFGYSAPPKRCKGVIEGISVELYATARYLTVTGHALNDGPIAEL